MYYAGLRPEEAAELHVANLTTLPEQKDTWGEIHLTHSIPRSGSRWTDSGKPREQAPLKTPCRRRDQISANASRAG
ncbi:hypothetical protein GCM10011575_46890 [Microlunatus endophyticus]|uniref:Phage integrase family protein n=1 Tax=Microlunatus endophyticus TaxID=1716077 RepID=A0A917W8I9_9ACTN|nr:hypothetical protein GCM10011575_46890 [Microlunatus endophyticus]